MAIMTRWRMPPDIWCGKSRARSSGLGMPTTRSISTARAQASFLLMSECVRMASTIWSPTRYTGFRLVMGSWKIIEICAPRICSISDSVAASRSLPSNVMEPPATWPGSWRSRMMDSEVTLLPDPDSPTTARISPGSTSNETPFTARTTPLRVGNSVTRSCTSSNATGITSSWLWGRRRRGCRRRAD